MVVEDDELVRRIVTKMLELKGYEVTNYPDAAPALEEADLDAFEQAALSWSQ